MGYLYGAAATDKIACGTAVAKANTWSLGVRFAPTSADASQRMLACYATTTGRYQAALWFDGAGTNEAGAFMSTGGGAAYPGTLPWISGITAGSINTLVATYDGANMRLYANTDATAKATTAETGTPDQDAGQIFLIGQGGDTGATTSAAGTIYETFWAPGVVYSGAQCAQFGAGFDARFLNPKPAHHWRLIADARDGIGNAHGTVTGATVVPHNATIYYPAPARSRRYSTAAAAAPTRRSLSLLGVS